MNDKVFRLVLLFLLSFLTTKSQQLVLNEVSQGASGAKEYVELVVAGTPSCTGNNSMDLRNYILDDNNGSFATGGGVGIAMGCVRLKNIPFWSSVPYGTILLIYNDSDLNPLVPAQDLSINDGNCRLVIPISNCTLLERFLTQPAAGNATYPTSGYTNCGGNWAEISMANGGDSFQTVTPAGGLVHAVSWGNNMTGTIIYFAGSAGSNVIFNANTANTNPANQANWTMNAVAGNETPGAANNAANAAWISSMNNNCTIITPFSISTSFTNAACICNGAAAISATGAIAPYTYTWFPGGSNASSVSNLCAGIYTVNALSSNSCLLTTTVAITAAPALSLSIASSSVSCFGNASGSASVTVSGGTPPYSYTWSPGNGHAATISNVVAGTYSVDVSSANNCTAQAIAIIQQPTASLQAVASITNIACANLSGGAIALTVSGGTGPYQYSWSPLAGSNAQVTNLTAGSYTSVITDANNCQLSLTHSVAPSTGSLIVNVTTTPVSCFGNNTGSATLIPVGGNAPYTYNWLPSVSSSSIASNLASGTYTVTIMDSGGCQRTLTVSVTQPTASLSVNMSLTPASCSGSAQASATITANGGTAPYSYTWLPSGGTASVSTGLLPGNYTVVVSDANACQQTHTVTINTPNIPNASVSSASVSCSGNSNGSATVSASGGTTPYTFNWGALNSNGTSVSNLSAGNYTVVVTDFSGCAVSVPFSILQPAALNPVMNFTHAGCTNSTGGSAQVSVTGGTAPYSYNWNPGGSVNSFITNLSAGNYSVVITDANNCTGSASVSIQSPSPFTLQPLSSSTICNGASVTLSASVTSPSLSAMQYTWLPSGGNLSSATVSPLSTTVYTLMAFDGCVTKSTSAVVTIEAKPQVGNLPSNEGCMPVCVSYNGPSALLNMPLTPVSKWIWTFSNGEIINSSHPSLCFQSAGNYTAALTLETETGCRYTYPSVATITVLQKPFADFRSNISYTTTEYEANFILTNQSRYTDSLVWFAPELPQYGNTLNFNAPGPGVYPVSVRAFNTNGCSDTLTRFLIVEPEFTLFAPNALYLGPNAVTKIFLAKGTGWDVTTFQMRIYNRWGQELYSTMDYTSGWDGSYGGVPVKDEVYVWKIDVSDLHKKAYHYTGHLTIIH